MVGVLPATLRVGRAVKNRSRRFFLAP